MNDSSSDPRDLDSTVDAELRSGPHAELQLVTAAETALEPMPQAPLPVPLRDYVLLESEKDRKTAAGLVIPDSAGPPCAIVAAAGPGAYEGGTFVPTKVKEGDRVLLDAPVGVVGKFRWAGKTYRICQERYFCAVLPGDQSFAESSPELTVPAPKLILPS